MNVIEIDNLTKLYGKKRGIENVTLTIKKGEIFGFIGPNGAGKSTTIKVLLNFIFPTSGSARIFNLDCTSESVKIKQKVGYVPSEVRYYDNMKVKSLLNYAKSFHKGSENDFLVSLCKDFDIELEKNVSELSLGNKKKVAIVQALFHKPQLLILDEPTNGLDPLIQQKLAHTLLKLKEEGTTIFLSSHNLTEVENFCDRVAVIKQGKIADIKNIADIISKRVKQITLKVSQDISEELASIGAKNLEYDKGTLSFNYKGDINILIKLLTKYPLRDLIIKEKSLSEVFMSYYEKEENR